ncbi:MAG TPA: ABC transporter ATP-binding protein [Spirochaetota bacterium]|nr:ABC transporter ATP-binding protein [Spirochaetota bacterium]
MENDTVIKVENLSKVYKLYDKPIDRLKESLNPFKKKYHHDFYALKDINFEIKKGETVGIIGANGAGKSTLLKVLTGVLTPSSGKYTVDGRISSLLELGTGFNPEFTGVDNIYFYGTINGYTKQQMDNLRDEIIAFADIGEYINQPLKTYSSGMLARLAFAVAVQVQPEILIIDEALSVGDMRFQQKAIRKMKDLMEKSYALLFVSHSTASIRSICNRAIWINHGVKEQDGEVFDITRNYEVFMSRNILYNLEEKDDKKIDVQQVNNTIIWVDVKNFQTEGDKSVIIESVSFYKKRTKEFITYLNYDEEVSFSFKLKVYEDLDFPNIVINFVNENGVNIFSFNSFNYEYKLESLSKGQELIYNIEFTFPRLKNGKYSISCGIGNKIDNFQKSTSHYIYDCIIFDVKNFDKKADLSSVFLISDFTVEIVR